MRILSKVNPYLLATICFFSVLSVSAQDLKNFVDIEALLDDFVEQKVDLTPETANVVVNQDPRIARLSDIKIEMDKEGAFSDQYKIQLYNGSLTEANEILEEAKEKFPKWKAEIIYETPNHKVQLGNFRSKLETDRALLKIRTVFPSAFDFQPNKKKK